VDEEENAIGLIPMVSSSDINDDIEPDVDYVLNGEEDGASIIAGSYTLVTSADADNYIAQIEISADVPAGKQDGLAVLPLGIRLAIDVDQVAVYSEELDSAISEEFGEELPTENQITEAVRKHVAFTKEWSDGTTAEIQLDEEDFKDAVDIWVEFDDEGEAEFVFLTVNLLIVNGGEPGMVDSAIVNDRQYIVIYDGELDDKFADPLKLTAATVESDDGDSATSGGGGGCSALGFVPGVALLFLPLWMLRRK
jgi:Synergist-CTERM protein sorting domain-containing protein